MEEDNYLTIASPAEGYVNEKMSKFLSFAIPVCSRAEAQEIVKEYANRYHDARHVCWAFMLGPERSEWMINDNGEPSGTAGKPILGQINSRNLTDVLVVVVRYFGGIKLGTPGLIAAYRAAAAEALDAAGVREMFRMALLRVTFPYQSADGVMKIVKGFSLDTLETSFDNTCSLLLSVRLSMLNEIMARLGKVAGVSLSQEENEPSKTGN